MADDKDVRELAEAKKLPLVDRIAHTNWKARVAAYEDISVACKEIYDDADPRLSEYAPLFNKAVAEPNAAAVDKALDALQAFLGKATEQHASRICERTCATMVTKCLSARTSTVQRVMEAMLLFIELEQAEKVTEALLTGLGNKNPKVVLMALELLFHALNLFGHRVVVPQPIIKALPALFEVKDNKARDKVKEIVVELARWLGPDTVRTLMFDKMRDAMKADINTAMEGLEPAPRQPPRLTRKQQAKLAEAREQPGTAMDVDPVEGVKAAVVEEERPPEADPYDFCEPKKVLPELKSDNFWAKLEEKKWTERRDALLLLKGLADTPRIAGGDFGDVMRELRKLISKDSNVVVVAESINCAGLLAKGLRKEFSSWAKNMAGLLFEKLKEKNTNVGIAVNTALSYMHKYCWQLLDIVEDLTEAMGHANPKVKEDTYKWLGEAVKTESKPNLKQLVAPLMGAAAKGAEEATPALREAALTFMANFTVRFGNTAILEKFGAKLDDARKKKLQEMVAEAMGGGGAAAAPAPAAAAGPGSALPPPSRSPAPVLSKGSRLNTARPATAMKSSSAAPLASVNSGSAAGGGAKKAAGGGDGDDEASLSGGTLNKDQAVAALSELMGESTVTELQDEQWKVRLDAMEKVVARVGEGDTAASSGSMLVQAMSHVPGWGEKNFQVMAKQFEVLRAVAAGCHTFSKRDAFNCINGVIDKVADLKLKQPSFDTLTSVAEAVGPQFVMTQLHKKAASHKNPKVQSETINWIGRAITEFGLAGCDVKQLLDWAKEDLGSANAGVRNAAIQMLGVMYRFLGPALGDMIRADVKPALMTAIDGEFAKNEGLGKPQPTRFSRAATAAKPGAAGGKSGAKTGGKAGAAAAAGGGGGGGGGFDADDLLPRTDISGLITSELVTQLSSANWKERKAGLDAIETILTQAGNRIQPQTGELLPELKKRMTDSNKNLTTQALTVLGRIAKAMGKSIDRNAKPLLAPAVKNITDQKQTVRSAVTEMLDAWVGVTSAGSVMPEVLEFYISAKITADGKTETLKWLAALTTAGKVGESAGDALRMGALGALDKAAEVRDAANKLLTALVEVVGAGELAAAAQGLESKDRKPALEAIAKVTGGPVPVAAAPVASTSRPATASVRASTTNLRASTSSLPKTSSVPASRPGTAKPGLTKSAAAAAAAAAAEGESLFYPDNKKDDRAKKGRFKPAKLQIMPDEAQTLEAEFTSLLNPTLKAAMFNKDFKKHCEAADAVTRALPNTYDDVIAVVDLLFRWATLRILESNTASLVKVLEMLKLLLEMMIDRGYRMSEYETKLIVPALVEKAGHNQDKLKAEHRELLKRLAQVYPPVKILAYVKDGLESKNSKTRVVCLDEVAAIVDRAGPSVYRHPPAAASTSGRPGTAAGAEAGVMAAVAKLVTERDTAVRAACLAVMEVIYCIEGQAVWDYLGRLTDQQKSLIEERIKAAGNRLARAGLAPGYKAAEYGLPVQEDVPVLPASTTPRRPASPLRRSGIGMGAGMSASPAAPRAGAGILDSSMAARSAALPPAMAESPVRQVAAPPPLAISNAYDMQRISSPMMMERFGSGALNVSASFAGGSAFLTVLEGPDDNATNNNWVIMHDVLQGDEWGPAVQAMKLLCYSYMELDKQGGYLRGLLLDPRNVDELVVLLAGRMDLAFANAAASTMCLPDGPKYDARACKYSVNALMNQANVPGIASGLGDTALKQLFSAMLACLIDARMRQLPDGDGLLKAVNMLIMKMLEHGNRPGVFGALLALLRSPNPRIYEMLHPATAGPAGEEEMLARWNDLVVKCLIKMTKQLGNLIPGLNVGEVLVHIHNYMQSLGADEVRRRSSLEDKPLRMVKTMLHELCKHRGYDIYEDVRQMPGVTMRQDDMVMLPYIRLNLETLQFPRPATGAPILSAPPHAAAAAAGAALVAAAAAPRPAAALAMEVPSTSAPAPVVPRLRGIPAAGTIPTASSIAGAPKTSLPIAAASTPSQPQVLAPLSTNSMPAPAPAASPKLAAPAAAAAPVAASVLTAHASINLDPSSREFTRPAADEQEARNILATIFKRIGDKAQSQQALVDLHHFIEANPGIDVLNQMLSQVSPYFKTYLQRGLGKVKIQMEHAAKAAAAAAASESGASPGGSHGHTSLDGGVVERSQRTTSSSWGTPDGEATVGTGAPMTVADKLAAAEAQPHSPMSPGRLRGVGNLDDLRNRMNNLSTNLNDLPLRTSATVQVPRGVSPDLLELQERMKKIQSIGRGD
ncbi:hypothetical protein HYH03_010264 [Edaphochlamys debaryana]|uniref:TOG domain-containing protein n=1 Tax=Edaphochlamys debaryana TaxID=47281 RepID=A0A835Y5L3_9CHLO|nr:hypothetical protein HYH03_010264 [Edaphochlamys debaryana]|eukprot:KAG2491479.1 hypothetical protein HYH03_010264 [Edaphochlamys debaryana]